MRKLMPSEAELAGYAGAPGGVLFKDLAPVRIPRSQAERGITWTDHSPGNGTGWAQRRILFNKFSNQ